MLWKLVENVKYEDIYEVTCLCSCLCCGGMDLLDVAVGLNEVLGVVRWTAASCRRLQASSFADVVAVKFYHTMVTCRQVCSSRLFVVFCCVCGCLRFTQNYNWGYFFNLCNYYHDAVF